MPKILYVSVPTCLLGSPFSSIAASLLDPHVTRPTKKRTTTLTSHQRPVRAFTSFYQSRQNVLYIRHGHVFARESGCHPPRPAPIIPDLPAGDNLRARNEVSPFGCGTQTAVKKMPVVLALARVRLSLPVKGQGSIAIRRRGKILR